MAAVKTPENKVGTTKRIRDVADYGGCMDYGEIALDSEYVTGGEAITFPGFRNVNVVVLQPRGGYIFDYTDGKIKVYVCNSQTLMQEIAASTDLSALSDIPYVAFGY